MNMWHSTPIFDTILLERTVSKIGVNLYTDSKSKCIKNWSWLLHVLTQNENVSKIGANLNTIWICDIQLQILIQFY